jgi:hypothetical protein
LQQISKTGETFKTHHWNTSGIIDIMFENKPSFEIPQQPFNSHEEEILYLKEQIKKKEEQLGENKESIVSENNHREVINEYSKVDENLVVKEENNTSAAEREAIVLDLEPEQHDDVMSKLIEILQTKGIYAAIKIVEQMENPHVEDDLHRFLVAYLNKDFPVKGLKEKSQISKDLKHTLYEISLPQFTEEDKQRPIEEIISIMEQLLVGLTSLSNNREAHNIDQTFTLEIAKEEEGDEYIFYISVPTDNKEMFEKQILAVYPQIKISIKKNDFNVFNPEGDSALLYASLKNNPVYPIKTYKDLEYDPMNILLNVFSKLKDIGEGVAIQIICNPVGDSYIKNYSNKLSDIKSGKDIKDVLIKQRSIGMDIAFGIKDALFSDSSPDKEGDSINPTRVDEMVTSELEEKISTPILETNIRIVASSFMEDRAKNIVNDIKSGFSQFENTKGNSFEFKEVKKRNRIKFIRDFSFRSFDHSQAVPLSVRELTTIYHFPINIDKVTSSTKQARSKTVSAPNDISKEGIVIGNNIHQGETTPIHFSPMDRLRHFYAIGQTGTGKTTIFKNMIIQDIKNGDGVCMIDPHGNDIQDILAHIPPERYDDVIYFDPAHTERPVSLNMLEYDTNFPEQKTFVVNEMMSIFNKLFDMKSAGGPMFEQYFRNATMLVIEDPDSGNTLLDISRVLSDKPFRDMKLEKCKNPLIVQFWREIAEKAGGEGSLQNIVPYITSKFDVFLSNEIMRPIVSQEKSSFDFRDVMDNKKILLVNLSKGRLGDINSSLLGLIIVGKILMSALSRVDSFGKELSPFYLYIDEFQNVTTDSISSILSEARKYGLGLNIAHQYISQLEEGIKNSVFGNVGSMAIYRLGIEDSEFISKQVDPVFTAKDIENMDNYNSCVKMLANGQPTQPFSMSNIKPDEGDISKIEDIKNLSYLKYGRDRNRIELEIMERYKKKDVEK